MLARTIARAVVMTVATACSSTPNGTTVTGSAAGQTCSDSVPCPRGYDCQHYRCKEIAGACGTVGNHLVSEPVPLSCAQSVVAKGHLRAADDIRDEEIALERADDCPFRLVVHSDESVRVCADASCEGQGPIASRTCNGVAIDRFTSCCRDFPGALTFEWTCDPPTATAIFTVGYVAAADDSDSRDACSQPPIDYALVIER